MAGATVTPGAGPGGRVVCALAANAPTPINSGSENFSQEGCSSFSVSLGVNECLLSAFRLTQRAAMCRRNIVSQAVYVLREATLNSEAADAPCDEGYGGACGGYGNALRIRR
jgi:hypothetical protein